MNPAAVLLIATVALWVGRLTAHRRIKGLELELELARLRVDDVDQIIDHKDRWRDQARIKFRRIQELAR